MSIVSNIEDREWFDTMLEERGDKFWELCYDKLFEKRVEEVEAEEMPKQEVAAFGMSIMEYGQYKGEMVKDIPLGYLTMLANGHAWTKKLNRYLRTIA